MRSRFVVILALATGLLTLLGSISESRAQVYFDRGFSVGPRGSYYSRPRSYGYYFAPPQRRWFAPPPEFFRERAPDYRRSPPARRQAQPRRVKPKREVAAATTRQIVDDPTGEAPGTIVVDTAAKHLFLVQEDGKALRYSIGVGREGFGWEGTTVVGRKAEWPDWRPPAEMRKRQPYLPAYMPGGPKNPLGARALYLYQDGKDTLFRIHGTNEAWSIGRNVSSGCIRLLNKDVIDLYARVPVGAKVIVR